MSITEWTAKPVPVRVCGPWDGSQGAADEFAEFVGEDNWVTYKGGAAEFWDNHRGEWGDVHIGQYLIDRGGKFAVVDEEELRESYEPAVGRAAKKAPEPGTGELATWKPEVIRVVDALRELDWTGFDPTSLDDLAEVAAVVVNKSGVSFAPLLPPPTE